MSDSRTIKIRELNDELRTKGYALNGRIVAMGRLGQDHEAKQIRVVLGASEFNQWTEGDDPYGEHDFGKFEVDGDAFIFKIDYYDLDETHGSEHPEDQKTTIRVMTLMYADDY
ncbi:DUF3768 domain-containing protein (plasmid) [Agrobacterium tumefaciens]|uniref:DUF3768 domain-containing protein n=1 Tax=Agrobacterium tumefaciens TaxID=358 RepID=UPI0021CF5CC0|nr:DUF3768 domain-containing protein [Agrobacterium tumefaciens]UXT53236.1 DUF3768 domain-containing protein [Agrobacterium tumefaciens]